MTANYDTSADQRDWRPRSIMQRRDHAWPFVLLSSTLKSSGILNSDGGKEKTGLKKETVIPVFVALLLVLIGAQLVFSISGMKELSADAPHLGANTPVDLLQRIADGEKAVAGKPKDLAAWIQLGNDYFDAGQPAQAVHAYDKALELDPDNADVLIDQGSACMRIGWYDKAVGNFEKALQIDPNHEQSLVKLGIVYAVDLKQPDKALKAWNRFLELNPSSPASQQVRLWAEQLKANPDALADRK